MKSVKVLEAISEDFSREGPFSLVVKDIEERDILYLVDLLQEQFVVLEV